MNKKNFIEKLQKETGFSEDCCIEVNDVLESHFLIGKNNKEKIINDFIIKLRLNEEEAESLYNKCVSILGEEMKNKLKHPFKKKKQ